MTARKFFFPFSIGTKGVRGLRCKGWVVGGDTNNGLKILKKFNVDYDERYLFDWME